MEFLTPNLHKKYSAFHCQTPFIAKPQKPPNSNHRTLRKVRTILLENPTTIPLNLVNSTNLQKYLGIPYNTIIGVEYITGFSIYTSDMYIQPLISHNTINTLYAFIDTVILHWFLRILQNIRNIQNCSFIVFLLS